MVSDNFFNANVKENKCAFFNYYFVAHCTYQPNVALG